MFVDVKKIAITGGPHAGKTTLLEVLEKHFRRQGYAVEIVPKAATQLITEGRGPNEVGMVPFQRHVLELSIAQEDAAEQRLLANPVKKKVMFLDRGVMDGAAYVSAEDMDALWSDMGYSIIDLRDLRYDAVLHLESTGIGLPHLFSNANNAARYEKSAEEAAEKCRKTLAVWVGCPHLAYIDNSTGFKGKIRRALTWVENFLADREHEHKFKLLTGFDRTLLPAHAQRIEIRQSYVRPPDTSKGHRIRMRGQGGHHAYFETMKKNRRGISCCEKERRLTATEYHRQLAIGSQEEYAEVVKDRWCFVEEGQYWELDVFRDWPHVLLEAEVPKPGWPVRFPSWLDGMLLDVSDNPNYTNKAISAWIAAARKLAA